MHIIVSMDSVSFENFRCFRERQTVRLAPLTLLVGENSTGKTSFMALIRALSDLAYGFRVPNFKEPPYDLGSFEDIAHRTGPDQQYDQFGAGLSTILDSERPEEEVRFEFGFSKRDSAPFPVTRRYERGATAIEESVNDEQEVSLVVATERGEWELTLNDENSHRLGGESTVAWLAFRMRLGLNEVARFRPRPGSPDLMEADQEEVGSFAFDLINARARRPRAGAPTRSRPHRSYDYARPQYDPEGSHIPNLLASFAAQDEEGWSDLKEYIGSFGRSAGLFDEINIKQFGADSEPFQVQVRKNTSDMQGAWRNIVDVGFGVSQVLPVVAEIAFLNDQDVFMIQQPEVHLHPRAQAALGSLLCSQATGLERHRRYVVETHSYDLINRVRMDVRDGVGGLSPDDVVVLYFERRDFDVKIHEITFDELGNLNGAPPSYGRFFMEETNRNLWPEDYAAVQ